MNHRTREVTNVKKLVLVDGAAGTGKSDLVEYVKFSHSSRVNILRKITTRDRRKHEEATMQDLEFISKEEFSNKEKEDKYYTYIYGGEQYGVRKKDIDHSIDNFEFTFVIIRNIGCIKMIKKDYSNKAKVIHIFIYSDLPSIEKRLRTEGYDDDAIKFRLERSNQVHQDYASYNSDVTTIVNDSEKANFHRKINYLIDQYSDENEPSSIISIGPNDTFPLIPPLIGVKEIIQDKLHDYDKNVFLMMKFRSNNESIYRYIKDQLEVYGLNCVRADNEEDGWNLTGNVYNPIAVLYCCKYGIALFDRPEEGANFNPNVAYELGIMHYQQKKCLILKHNSLSGLPFDLIKDLYKEYGEPTEIGPILKKWIRNII